MDVGDAERIALCLPVDDVAGYEQRGDDLLLVLSTGETILLEDFFRQDDDGQPVLALVGAGRDGCGCLVEVSFADDASGVLKPIVSADSCNFGFLLLGGLLLGGGVALAAGSGGGGAVAPRTTLTIGDTDGDGRPEASGVTEPGTTVRVTWPDGTTSEVIADGSGNWTVESPTTQPDGDVVASPTDPNGNTGPDVTAPYVDTSGPSTTLVIGDADGDGRPEASGVTEPGSTVTVTWPDGTTSEVVADGSGNWTVESPVTQPEGDVTADATDPNGNTGPEVTAPYVDTSGPSTTLVVGDTDGDGRPEASGVTDPGSTVTVTWPDGTTSEVVADGSGNWTVESPVTQPEGDVTAEASDPDGNAGPEVTAPYVDTSGPSTTLVVGDTDGDGMPEASGVTEPGSTVTVTWPDGTTSEVVADGSGNWTVESPVTQPEGDVTADATDPNGNTGPEVTAPYVDTIAPAAPVVTAITDDNGASASDAITNDNTLVFSGTVEASTTVEVFLDGVSLGTTMADAAGNWSFDHTATTLADGTYQVTATATDPAGNVSPPSAVFPVTVDTTAPAAPVVAAITDDNGASASDAITNDNTLVFSGTAEANTTVEVFLDGVSLGTTMADAAGNWSFDHTATTLADGTYQVTATATDAAGNISPTSAVFPVVVDTTLPLTIQAMSNDYNLPTDLSTHSDGTVVSGSSEPGSVVEIFVDGVSIGTVIADATGTWLSPQIDLSALPAGGSLTVTAETTDLAGNFSTVSQVIAKEAIFRNLIDLSTLDPTEGFVVQGENTNDRLGFSVQDAGDVNGDGIDDFVVGARLGDNGTTVTGEAYVIFGKEGGGWNTTLDGTGREVLDVANLDPADGFLIQGQNTGHEFSYRISSVGDVNGDGIDDIGATAPLLDGAGVNSGRSYIIFGKAGGAFSTVDDGTGRQMLDLNTLAPEDGFFINNDSGSDGALGMLIRPAGDLNDDGIDDFVIANPADTGLVGGGGQIGAATVIFGKNTPGGDSWNTVLDGGGQANLDLATLSPDDGFIIYGDDLSDRFAHAATSAGDVNGDGIDDLIIGAQLGDDGGLNASEAYVIYGKAGGGWGAVDGTGRQVLDVTNLSPADGFIVQGYSAGGQAGFYVEGVGDVDGDGLDDFIVTAPEANGGSGEAYVVFGKNGGGWGAVDGTGRQVLDLATLAPTDGFILAPEVTGDHLGWYPSSTGDVNGDGLSDFMISANNGDLGGTNAGQVYVVLGKQGGGWGSVDGTGRQVLNMAELGADDGFIVMGDAATDGAGGSVAFAGDINGDGFDDMIVGAQLGDDGGVSAGEAYVIFGRSDLGGVNKVGTAAADWLAGSDSGDQLTGLGGADTLLGHGGNDVLVVSDAGFARIDGGADQDTLVLSGGGIALDFTAIDQGVVTGIEVIDITGSGANTLTLTEQDVLDMSDTTDILRINADGDDTVTATGFVDSGTDQTVGTTTYDVYTSGAAQLWIDQAATAVV